MRNLGSTLAAGLVLASVASAWPAYNSSGKKCPRPIQTTPENDFCIDTNHVHSDCGDLRPPNADRHPGVRYQNAYRMQFDKWDITCDFADPDCFPPYYPSAPEKLKDKKYPMVNGPGYTYYNASHRGGS